MDNIESTPKRGRPAIKDTNTTNRRNEVALAVLKGVLSGSNVVVDNKHELSRFCYEMADVFIEVGVQHAEQ